MSQVIPTHGNTLKSACLTKSSAAETLAHNWTCDVKSYEALFTAQRVNHLYHQMNLGA